MSYDLFISYARSKNEHSRVTQLVERIKTDLSAFAGRPLVRFFDASEIQGYHYNNVALHPHFFHSIVTFIEERTVTLAEVLPAVRQLTASEKLKLIRLLAEELDREDVLTLFEQGKVYDLPTPYDSCRAAQVLADALAVDRQTGD